MEVINGGDVTYGCYVEILVDKSSSEELCEQLQVTVTCGDKTISTTLNDLNLGGEGDYLAILDLGCISTFSLELKYIL